MGATLLVTRNGIEERERERYIIPADVGTMEKVKEVFRGDTRRMLRGEHLSYLA